ncbi:hypothetical protein FACS1894176_06570 [Bacteroidia bacterium]|nr:hypothetical protein FACS189428_2260 [Clostridia bacterium]GHV26242.1 hypothetical protein FACS1894176_06570 [Bacteroidia bacterium]
MKTYTQFWDQLQHAYPVSKGKFRLPIATKFLELDAEKLANFEANLITLTQSLLDSAVTQPNYRETISKNEPQILPLLQGNFTGILRYDVLLDQNGDFKVIEINADYPDGLVLHDYTYSTLFGADDHKNTQLYLQLFDPEQTIFVLYPKDARFVDAYYQEYETLKKN